MYFLTATNDYYEGDKIDPLDTEVTRRPNTFYEMIDGQWVLNSALKRQSLKPLSARQVRLILTQFGYREAVEAGLEQASQDVKDEWNFANEFERTSPVLNGMAQALGLTDEQVDAMFEQGAFL